MKDKQDYFDVLGLKPTASRDEIDRAYQRLMEYWNPDRVPDYYKQKALVGRERVEEAYLVAVGLREPQAERKTPKTMDQDSEASPQELGSQKHKDDPTPQEQATSLESIPRRLGDRAARILVHTDVDGTAYYVDKESVTVHNDRVEIDVDVFPPETNPRLRNALACSRRAGHKGVECLVEKWVLGSSSKVFVKHGLEYRSKCGHLGQVDNDARKVWKPIAPSTLEETVWNVVTNILSLNGTQRSAR
jgi:hypothetical protein